MKNLFVVIGTLAAMTITPAFSQSDNNASAKAPGQDRTCLVTTGVPNSWADKDVTGTKWLPRKAADAQAKKDPTTMKTFEYENDPLVTGGQYASAEDLCNKHFVK